MAAVGFDAVARRAGYAVSVVQRGNVLVMHCCAKCRECSRNGRREIYGGGTLARRSVQWSAGMAGFARLLCNPGLFCWRFH